MLPTRWQLLAQSIDLTRGPVLMGVINLTPDSFSDGGRLFRNGQLEAGKAIDYALQLADEGAAILDFGAESTRPGSRPIDESEELRRLVPVVGAVCEATAVPVSIDTYRAAVARECLAAGAEIVNDISAATFDEGMLPLLCETGAAVCLMHKLGTPQTMQAEPFYEDVVAEVTSYLAERKNTLTAAGVLPERIVFDPGIGFGKTAAHNLRLLRETGALHALGQPLLYGVSRKRFLDAFTGVDHSANPEYRLPGTLAVTLSLASRGVQIFRVHDVAAVKQALDVYCRMTL
ncbi:MAG: dihydropteroate synthase [Planctomycetaceae bacterium]|nr:dihydropteroate synthase [Planctomycetaceae bacterium]